MESGKLRHRLAFYQPEYVQNDTGEAVVSYGDTPAFELWGSLEPLNGRELERARQLVGNAVYRAKVRYDSRIALEQRIYYRQRWFEIGAILNPQERNRELELILTEVIE